MEAYQNGMQDNATNPKLLQHIAWLRLQVLYASVSSVGFEP
jgi:hypothetical protein